MNQYTLHFDYFKAKYLIEILNILNWTIFSSFVCLSSNCALCILNYILANIRLFPQIIIVDNEKFSVICICHWSFFDHEHTAEWQRFIFIILWSFLQIKMHSCTYSDSTTCWSVSYYLVRWICTSSLCFLVMFGRKSPDFGKLSSEKTCHIIGSDLY